MNTSRIVPEDKVYVKFDDSGKTQIVNANNIQPGFCYRRVHNTHQDQQRKSFFSSDTLFADKSFIIDENQFSSLSKSSQRIVLRRLYDLYKMSPKSMNPQFFPTRNFVPKKLSSDPHLPPFATQIGVFPAEYYKSFFITQDFAANGMYEMIINQKGRFQTDVVDDWVPVYEHSLQHIWGLDLDQAWQIILLKFWAKRNRGYHNIPKVPPFFFLQCFSNSNWKYYNLQKDGFQFLTFYTGRTDLGKFILKTKNSQLVKQAGLIPNSAGYQLINLVQTTGPVNNKTVLKPTDRKWIGTVRSTMVNKWSGSMSVLDKEINSRYYPQKHKLSLQRDFMISETDLLNLFSTAFIASRRDQQEKHYISDYYLLSVEPNNKKSIYLRFEAPTDGWFDFCIKQVDDNRISPVTQSKFRAEQYGQSYGYSDGLRFLKCKFILVKQNNSSSPSTFNEINYSQPFYDTYQIQYYHGYNRGDAKFLNLVKGFYILKIKPEQYMKQSYFVVNYASSMPIQMTEIFPDKKQTSRILRQSMASLIGPLANVHQDVDRKFQQIVYSNSFENIGYGFVGLRVNKLSPYSALLQIHPDQVAKSGYKIKNQFKRISQPFSVQVKPGQSTAIVLKKIPGVNYVWPPRGFETFKQKI